MHLEPLTYKDLSQLKSLQPEGWTDITEDFIKYINYDFCEPVKASIDGKLVGVGSYVVFDGTAWIAHMIVSTEYRNKGIGSEIFKHLIADLQQQNMQTILLLATELGAAVYQKLGFEDISEYNYLKRVAPWPKIQISKNIIAYSPQYYDQVMKLDASVSGESRGKLIEYHLDNCMVYMDKAMVKGMYLPFLGEGLIYANTSDVGIELMKLKYSMVDKAVLPSENKLGIDFLQKYGFDVIPTKGTRMILGQAIPWKPDCIYSRIGGNYG